MGACLSTSSVSSSNIKTGTPEVATTKIGNGSGIASGAVEKAKADAHNGTGTVPIEHDEDDEEEHVDDDDEEEEEENITSTITFQYHKGTCALEYYEPIKSLGEGSISSIHLVKRRKRRVSIPYRERADIMLHATTSATTDTTTNTYDDNDNPQESTSSKKERDQQVYVLKSIMKDHVTNDECLEEMRREIYTMKYLDHINIVKVYEAFERRRHVYLIMEYGSGGDLYKRFPYTELNVRDVIKQILSAVTYLHSKKVIHRDLKLENIVYESSDLSNITIKLIDFGLATKYLSDEYRYMNETVGTVYTMAPQVVKGEGYTSACDLWSIGVICYTMLSNGTLPFQGTTKKDMVQQLLKCNYIFDNEIWQTISKEAKDFIQSLLQIDPRLRPTASAALKSSKWMKKEFSSCCSDTKNEEGSKCNTSASNNGCASTYQKEMDHLMLSTCETLNAYSQEAKLKRLALMYLAHNSPPQDIINLRDAFRAYDISGDGTINFWEFHQVLSKYETAGLSKDDVQNIFNNLDIKRDGYINYTEFLAATLETRGRIDIDRLRDVFNRFDIDRTGTISKQNLIQALGGEEHYSKEYVNELLDELNIISSSSIEEESKNNNNDEHNGITFDEFAKLFELKQQQELNSMRSCCTTTSTFVPEATMILNKEEDEEQQQESKLLE